MRTRKGKITTQAAKKAQHITGQTILPTVPGTPYNNTYGAAEITEYTSDNAPGTLFTIVRSREGVATVSTPVTGTPTHSEFNVRSNAILPAVDGTPYTRTYGAAEITEFTSDSAPGELFTIVRSRERAFPSPPRR